MPCKEKIGRERMRQKTPPPHQNLPPPNVWGPSVWRAIHYIALGFPTSGKATASQKEAYRAFFRNLDGVLPCATCAENYREHLKSDIAPVEDAIEAGSLFEWTVQLHNVVSGSLGKPRAPWTTEQAIAELMASHEPRRRLPLTMLSAIAIIVVLIAIILACIVRWVFDIRLRERA